MAVSGKGREPTPPGVIRPAASASLSPRAGLRRPGPPQLQPVLRILAEQLLIAGPICGVLSALYRLHLVDAASPVFDPALHATVRQMQSWHGRAIRPFFITPTQNAISWALSVPAIAWLVLVLVGVVVLGVRSHYAGRNRRPPR